MTSASETHPKSPRYSISLLVFVTVSALFITIYFLRFMQVLKMRELILQGREINYKVTIQSLAYIEGNKKIVQTPDMKIKLPLETAVEPGSTYLVRGSVNDKVQPLSDRQITLIGRQISPINGHQAFGIRSFYKILVSLEGLPRVLIGPLSGLLETDQVRLLVGLVFGGVSGLSKQVLDDLKTTGLAHVTSASGFNVSILIGFSLGLFTRAFNRRIAAAISLVFVFAYSVMAGFSPPITRAGIMGGLYLVSVISGKQYSVVRSLLLAIMFMLIYQPFLIFSVSFQLSVASTLGLVYSSVLFPSIDKRVGVFSELFGVLEEGFKITLGVLAFSAPILIGSFGTFSLVAPIANAFLLWLVAPMTLLGMGFIALAIIFPLAAAVFAAPFSLLLEVFVRAVHYFAGFPLAAISLTPPAWWGYLAWYVCLIWFLRGKWHSTPDAARK